MSDPRLTPFNGRVAHSSLRGTIEAEVFTDGTIMRITTPLADLSDTPQGARQCQMLYGEAFLVLEENDFYAYGVRQLDGYVGWTSKSAFKDVQQSPFEKTAYKIIVPRAVFLEKPDIKSVERGGHWMQLSLGSTLWHRPFSDESREAALEKDGWLCTMMATTKIPQPRYVRWSHVAPIDAFEDDPAAVAERFIHTPYLWGGDSGFGIDCSGLIQRALMACGKICPRDSDMQLSFFPSIERDELKRGDLVFWKGHVGMMLDPETLIHANAHHMAVAIEPLDQAIVRIGEKEFGDVIGFGRT